MRGPQFMLGYWKEPAATAAVLRDGWYWSGDVVTRDRDGFYCVVDRRKEMIKFKGFPVAPAEVEAVLLEHPAVKECGVVGRSCDQAGEIPVAFVALRAGFAESTKLQEELCSFVADRLTHYKQPREVYFLETIPKTASSVSAAIIVSALSCSCRSERRIQGSSGRTRPSPRDCCNE